MKLDHFVIAVSDWERSNAFYRDVCGAELVRLDEHGPVRWRYRFGEVQLNVHGPGMADLAFEWDGLIEHAVEHLEGCGVEISLGPVPRNGARGPGRSVYFSDPDGNLLELISYHDPPA